MEIKIKLVTKWFSDSRLKVNEPKSEVCIFYKKDTHPITIDLNGSTITSSNTMNVLWILRSNFTNELPMILWFYDFIPMKCNCVMIWIPCFEEKQTLTLRAWARVAWDGVVFAGLCFKFTTVKMQGLDKPINHYLISVFWSTARLEGSLKCPPISPLKANHI